MECFRRDTKKCVSTKTFPNRFPAFNELEKKSWMTDETVSTGSWCYTQDLKIKPTADVLHVLIDIVSKNGVLLLNISPKSVEMNRYRLRKKLKVAPKINLAILSEISDPLTLNAESS